MPMDADAGAALDRFEAWFVSLADQALTGPVLAAAIAVAFAAGALHALGPGHGKTIMAAYLAGTDGRVGAAVSVGVIVAVMHTFSAVVLGGVVYALIGGGGQLISAAVPVMSVAAGMLVTAVGGTLAHRQLRHRRAARRAARANHAPAAQHYARIGTADTHHHDHHHDHSHDHDHGHHHALPPGVSPTSPKGLATIGLAGGLLPSPASFLVLTTAIFSGQAILGFGLVLTFGLGLAATLTGVGVLTVHGRRLLLDRSARGPRLAWASRHLPLISSFALIGAGLWVSIVSLVRL